ncbi:cell surface protein [Colletotrichum higginsianum]|nr:cell surface protein [Colletotrichum higginsianum]
MALMAPTERRLTGNSPYSSNVATGYDDPDGVHGPHGGRAANKVDPRVDSDRDHRGAPGSGLTGNNTTHGTRGTHGTTMGSGVTGSNNPYSSNVATGYDDPDGVHGPHGGRAANKVDPRVDSDRDHRGAPGSGLTGSNNYGTGTGHSGGLSSNPHGGATSGIAGNRTTGYDDPDGVHGPHSGRAANKIDPRVDSDRDHRGAPGTHRTTDSGVDVGHNKPYPGDNLRNTQEPPYWGDVGRDGQPVTGTHGTLNKDLPLRPNESGIGRGGPQAVGGGTYNASATHHHDPASSVDRSMEGRDFTHPHQTGNAGVGGAGSDPYSGVHSAAHNPQAALAGEAHPTPTTPA